ncbi:MAG: SCO family protein [Acidobacteriota bacterium]|nr:SCO family protein [Acidobacteriota bacterium]
MHRGVILLLAGLTATIGCSRKPDARRYELQGQVLAVKADTNEILIKHEDIPGFMPAMTMPYVVKDAAILKDRAPGDLITATLMVAPGSAWLSAITKTGSAPLPEDARTDIPAAAGVHLLTVGDAVPDTKLIDQDGAALSLADWRGSPIVVSFIYTRCPLPQFCPLVDRRFAEIQKMVASDPALNGRVRLLSISFDPKTDQPAVLRAHAAKLNADPAVWRFATADASVVDRLAATFGVNVIREKDGTITHNLRTAVIDPQGRIAAIHDSNAWIAATIADELRTALHAR